MIVTIRKVAERVVDGDMASVESYFAHLSGLQAFCDTIALIDELANYEDSHPEFNAMQTLEKLAYQFNKS